MTSRPGQTRLAILVIAVWLCSLGLYKFHQVDKPASWLIDMAKERLAPSPSVSIASGTYKTLDEDNEDSSLSEPWVDPSDPIEEDIPSSATHEDLEPLHQDPEPPHSEYTPDFSEIEANQTILQSYPQNFPDDAEIYDYAEELDPENQVVVMNPDPIIIVQHFHNNDDIHMKSMENHKRYADAHGYKYHPDTTQYIENERNWNAKTLNKAYAILSAMLGEMAQGDRGAKWLFFADGGDTFFYDPSIPLSAYLPPPGLRPEPFILASQDWNGFNAGVLMLRINQKMASFFSQIIGTPNTHPMLEGQNENWEASDQWIMGTLLNEGRNDDRDHVASHFYNIPKMWLNAYSIREDEYNVGEWEAVPPVSTTFFNETTGMEETIEGEWTAIFHAGWQPRCHVHFPAQQFQDLDELYENVEKMYELGLESAKEKGLSGNGLESLGWGMKAAKLARVWWRTEAKAGLEDVKFFLDEGDRPEGIAVR